MPTSWRLCSKGTTLMFLYLIKFIQWYLLRCKYRYIIKFWNYQKKVYFLNFKPYFYPIFYTLEFILLLQCILSTKYSDYYEKYRYTTRLVTDTFGVNISKILQNNNPKCTNLSKLLSKHHLDAHTNISRYFPMSTPCFLY